MVLSHTHTHTLLEKHTTDLENAHLLLVQISPANIAYMYEWNVVSLNIYLSQGSAATELMCGGRFYLPYSAVYLRIQKWKNDWNRSTFAKVIVQIKVAQFFLTHSVYNIYPPVTNFLHCMCAKSPKVMKIGWELTKLLQWKNAAHPV